MIQTLSKVTDEAIAQIVEEMRVRRTTEVFLLFPMGSQFDHLIKQKLDKLGVFCLVADPATVRVEDIRRLRPIGIIISGGPASVHSEPPPFDTAILGLGIPVFGICLGFQMISKFAGCTVEPAEEREFGPHVFSRIGNSPLFRDCPQSFRVIQSHGDAVIADHSGFEVLGSTENAPVAAGRFRHLSGVQFHPEVEDTQHGDVIFDNFCFGTCRAKDRFPAENLALLKVEQVRKQIEGKKVLLALSGGSDSSTVAYILKHAIKEEAGRVRAVYIKGIDRPDDERFVGECFGTVLWLELVVVDATDRFLAVLAGKTAMKEKRRAMKSVYREVLEEQAVDFGAHFIAQGTLYTDLSESGQGYVSGARKATIKEHHNTVNNFSLPELIPLSDCVKDGCRNIGRALGVPEDLLVRHPFPGPGLVVRIEGEVTADKLRIARKVDDIYLAGLRKWDLYKTVWQAGGVITSTVTTCTKGDDATSGILVVLWAVWSVNGFTARWAELPPDFIREVSTQITDQIREVGAVAYRVSDKPPSTLEMG
ncbi:MAG: glutamine-hydrolyzing GMP synthase [Candidatus Doudnabacteria bacterium]|nr:glutamine-hydrolyzing GMP synthase [Candidatus Doudnabacteria bacterium]